MTDLTQTSQIAASDPAASSWVSASAGTGKTHVLTARVLRLLLSGSPAERILCLTFTRAAAAEMANRVSERLGAWAIADDTRIAEDLLTLTGRQPGPKDIAGSRQLFAKVLDAPGGLKIQTIHSFCESLLGRFPVEAGLPAHFRVMDDRTAAELFRTAREKVLQHDLQRAKPLVARLIASLDEDSFSIIMKGLARDRGRLQHLLRHHKGIDATLLALKTNLRLHTDDTSLSIRQAGCSNCLVPDELLRRTVGVMTESSNGNTANKGLILADWISGELTDRMSIFRNYSEVFLTKALTVRAKILTKEIKEAVPEAEEAFAKEGSRLIQVWQQLYAMEIFEHNEAILRLGSELIDAYTDEKTRNAYLDYDDQILKTKELLTRPGIAPWVLFKLDGGLDHILIDEAQDTNPDQWEVVTALADEFFSGEGARDVNRTIFAVGDAKQSIYSFQRADPASFEEMRRYFAERVTAAQMDWRPVNLETSFRSTSAVLDSVDAVFAGKTAMQGVSFSGEVIRHRAFRTGHPGRVELWPLVEADPAAELDIWAAPIQQKFSQSAQRKLAQKIAERISAWLRSDECLARTGRPVKPGDIMILLRSRTPIQDEIIRALKENSIPVAGVDRMMLVNQLVVKDLLSVGRFLLMPEDDLNLAILLKTPLIGLSEDDLFGLSYERQSSLWHSLNEKTGIRPAYAKACQRLRGWLSEADMRRPFDFFADILNREGGRYRIWSRLGAQANDPIDEFLSKALEFEGSHAPGMQGFVQWISEGSEEIKRDQDQGQDEVRVMTVHGSKGLQAPIVILPEANSKPDFKDKLFWLPSAQGPQIPVFSPRSEFDDPVTAAARERAREAQDQEYHRLLYVALTRAEDRLYIAGIQGARAVREDSWYGLCEKALKGLEVTEVEMPDGDRVLRLEIEGRSTRGDQEPEEPLAHPNEPPAWVAQAAPAEAVPSRPLAPSRLGAEPALASPLGGGSGQRFRRGNLIHLLLQGLPDLPAAERRQAAERYLGYGAHDLDEDQRREICDTTLAVLEDERFAAIFAAGSRAEVPLTGVVGDKVISGEVDRLLIGDSHILLVDYKTNRPAPKEIADCPKIYLRQMAAYRALLNQIYPDKTIYCGLLWTDGPNLMEIPEALLDENAPVGA